MRPEIEETAIAAALEAFVARVGAGRVRVAFVAGTASLSGVVGSETQRQALDDLVRAHDGVRSVHNGLVVQAAAGHMSAPPAARGPRDSS
jgi:osmotically-inducible protein OsmY